MNRLARLSAAGVAFVMCAAPAGRSASQPQALEEGEDVRVANRNADLAASACRPFSFKVETPAAIYRQDRQRRWRPENRCAIMAGMYFRRNRLLWSVSLAVAMAVAGCGSPEELSARMQSVRGQGGAVHYLPPYRADRVLQLGATLGVGLAAVAQGTSPALIRAVVAQRSVKSGAEVDEIEDALTGLPRDCARKFRTPNMGCAAELCLMWGVPRQPASLTQLSVRRIAPHLPALRPRCHD